MLLKIMYCVCIVSFLASCFLYWKWNQTKQERDLEFEENQLNSKKLSSLQKRFASVISIDEEYLKVNNSLRNIVSKLENLKKEKNELDEELEKSRAQINLYEDNLELNSYGFYKPVFTFDKSEDFKEKIIEIREEQKQMLKENSAIFCKTEWSVGGDKKKGLKMTKELIKLTSRAFINECDVFIGAAQWNNLNQIKQKIENSFNIINKANESHQIVISEKFKNLKIIELQLNFEYKNMLKEEKEEIAEEKRRIKEEERERIKNEEESLKAEREANNFEKMLEKAKQEAQALVQKNEELGQEKLDLLNKNILELEAKLKEAEAKKERAKSMAQQTKSGHVYVISNIGSFGENVYKIGMTRRLEPLDRISELSDASVPFIFDVHAIIYSDNAPELESQLHKKFHERRVNLINCRKEFFKVSLDEIKNEVLSIFPDSKFRMLPEAEDYRKTLNLRKDD